MFVNFVNLFGRVIINISNQITCSQVKGIQFFKGLENERSLFKVVAKWSGFGKPRPSIS